MRWGSPGHSCRLRPDQRAPEHHRRADRRPALGHAFGNAYRRAEARRARGHVQEQLRGQLELLPEPYQPADRSVLPLDRCVQEPPPARRLPLVSRLPNDRDGFARSGLHDRPRRQVPEPLRGRHPRRALRPARLGPLDGVPRQDGRAPSDYSTDVLAHKAVSFVAHARGPFFLEFAPFGPHDPATPPPRYKNAFQQFSWKTPPSFDERDLSDKPAYIRKLAPLNQKQLGQAEHFRRQQLAAARAVDDAVSALVKTLEARHMLRTTMIVFASDNGVSWGEHQLIAARKLVPYEESIRVPLVIRYDPLMHARPREDGRLALNIDLAP